MSFSGNSCSLHVDRSVQTNEGDIDEDDTETTKSQKRSSSLKGRFPWKILGSKDKDTTKETSKVTSPTTPNDALMKKNVKLASFDDSINRKNVSNEGSTSSNNSSNTSSTRSDTSDNTTASDGQTTSKLNDRAKLLTNKMEFSSDHYAGIETTDKNSEKNNSQNPDEIKTQNDAQTDAPFIILNQTEFSEHTSPIVSCRFSGDNNRVASLDLDGTFKVWQCYPEVSPTSLFSSKGDIFLCLDWVPNTSDKVLVGKANSLISLTDVSNKRTLWESCVHQKYKRITHVNCSPVSTSAVCSAVMPLSDARKNALPASTRFSNQSKVIKMKQYSANTDLSTARQGIISEWDLNTGQFKSELCMDPYPVYIHSMDYNHNGTLLVTGGADGMVRLFDIRNSDCLVGWHAHSTEILDVIFNSSETSIYSIAADGKVCVWDINKVSSKIAEFPLEVGCTGMHHYWSSGQMGGTVEDIPSSQLLACDSEGQHMMTCGPCGLMIYKVQPATTMHEAMHVLCERSEVVTLDWASSPNCSTVMCGTKQGVIQVSTLLRK